MATAADSGDFKELLLEQLQRGEAVEALLEAAAPAASVGLEAKIKLSYFTEPPADFHVSFSFLGKQYNADFVSAWEILSRKRVDDGGTQLRGEQQQHHHQQQQSHLVPQQQQQPLEQQAQHEQQQPQGSRHFQQNQQQQQRQQDHCLPRLRVQIVDAVVTFGETSVNASFGSSVARSTAEGKADRPSSCSSPSSSAAASSSSSSPSTLASPFAVNLGTAPAREAATVPSVMLEESSSQRELITVSTTVSVDTVCFTWGVIQQVADAVLSVGVGRTFQDQEKAASGELMPRVSCFPGTAGQQPQPAEAALAPKKSVRGDALPSMATKSREKSKTKVKEIKPVPLFDVFQRGEFQVGRLLLLANDECLRSTPALNAQISQVNAPELERSVKQVSQVTLDPRLAYVAWTVDCPARLISHRTYAYASGVRNGTVSSGVVFLLPRVLCVFISQAMQGVTLPQMFLPGSELDSFADMPCKFCLRVSGIHSFSIELWCSQAPLSQSWRALLNPVCITFIDAQDIPLPLPSAQPGQRQIEHSKPPQWQQPAATLSEEGELSGVPGRSGLLDLPDSSSGETTAGVYLEGQWLKGAKFRTPVRPLQLQQTYPYGFKKGEEKFRRAHATWEHDVICFCGPALLNPLPLYQYLENIPLHVALHQTSDMLRQQEEAQETLRPSRKQRLLPQSTADAWGGEAVCFGSGSASTHSGRAANHSLSTAVAAARPSTHSRQSMSPQKGSPKASALKAAGDGRGAKRTEVRSSQCRRERVTSSDLAPEETNVMPAYGAADFDLGDICRLRLKYLELVSDVYPVSVKAAADQVIEHSELERTIPTAAALLSSHLEAFRAVTTRTRRTPTPYLEFGTRVKLRIQFAEPVTLLTPAPQRSSKGEIENVADDSDDRRVATLSAEATLRYEPFGLVVAVADDSEKQLFTTVKEFVERHNMRILNLKSLDALHLEVLHADNPSHAALDVLTGFILSDGRRHMLVAEGLRGQGLQQLSSTLKREENAVFWKKLLYNPCIGFPRRFYTAFNLRLRWIRLQTPLEELLHQPLLLDSSTVEAQQLAAVLDQFAALLRAARMKEAKLAKAFPSAAGLMQLSHMHGEDEESEDSRVCLQRQKPIEALVDAS